MEYAAANTTSLKITTPHVQRAPNNHENAQTSLGSVFSKLAINIADLQRMAGYTTLPPNSSRLAPGL